MSLDRDLFRTLALTVAGLLCPAVAKPCTADDRARHVSENVILITYDGLRWQEVFSGATDELLDRGNGGVRDVPALKDAFWRDTPEARRESLLPFFWKVIAAQGQVFGDPERGSIARVTNGHNFSYPGYSEILTGFHDEQIDSNAKRPNPNETVLEWLNGRPGFQGRVAAFCSWDVFPFIINAPRSGIPVNAGWQPLAEASSPEKRDLLNELARETPHTWENVRYDVFTFHGALDYLKRHKPRVLYVAFGETDDWAHDGRYDQYLSSARRTDGYIARLWEVVQAMPEYAGKTSLVLTTDHGRGDTRTDWKNHGKDVPGADRIWIAVMGPDTPPDKLRKDVRVEQRQVAATVAALAGQDYHAAVPASAPPLPGVRK